MSIIVDIRNQKVRVGELRIQGKNWVDLSGPYQNCNVIDLQGKWVMPGLIDLHVHSSGNANPTEGSDEETGIEVSSKRMARAGVTAFLDLGNVENEILPLRDHQRAGTLSDGAEIFAAGPVFAHGMSSTPIGGNLRVIRSAPEAQRQVKDLARKHPDVIKILYGNTGSIPDISLEKLKAAIKTAKSLGLKTVKTVIHIGSWNHVRKAILAGATAITHLDDDSLIPDDVVQLMQDHHIISIPTMVVQSDMYVYDE